MNARDLAGLNGLIASLQRAAREAGATVSDHDLVDTILTDAGAADIDLRRLLTRLRRRLAALRGKPSAVVPRESQPVGS